MTKLMKNRREMEMMARWGDGNDGQVHGFGAMEMRFLVKKQDYNSDEHLFLYDSKTHRTRHFGGCVTKPDIYGVCFYNDRLTTKAELSPMVCLTQMTIHSLLCGQLFEEKGGKK
uniref:Uncharacterized protein n=1 Tax=Rhizophora mucronata TaxID=61149 RepID=A0A2P2Q7L8_RHIMU